MDRRNFLHFVGCGCLSMGITSCTTAPITERKQLKLIPESQLNAKAAQLYEKVKKKEKLINDHRLNDIKNIGKNMEYSIGEYFDKSSIADPTVNFDWEYILIDKKKVINAWCMPGGKIAVYTGMLDITRNNNGLAAVMGHEIAHAVAKHSVERASRALVLNVGTAALDIFTGGAISNAQKTTGVDVAGMLRTFGIENPFGRKQEREADYLGLIFSSLSGYDIRESLKIWERMQDARKGEEPPEWMSTHPSTANRIESLKLWIPQIIVEYPPIKKIT